MTRKAPRPESAADDEVGEYDAFEKLTRKLVKVPKREIDAERARKNGERKDAIK
jgi:hypothetical protein